MNPAAQIPRETTPGEDAIGAICEAVDEISLVAGSPTMARSPEGSTLEDGSLAEPIGCDETGRALWLEWSAETRSPVLVLRQESAGVAVGMVNPEDLTAAGQAAVLDAIPKFASRLGVALMRNGLHLLALASALEIEHAREADPMKGPHQVLFNCQSEEHRE